MNKQEKQRQWLIEQGYKYNGNVFFAREFRYEIISNSCLLESEIGNVTNAIGIFKNKQFIPMPQFEDDKPEPEQREDIPVDKALQEYIGKLYICNDATELKAWQEVNNRLKALEAKTK